MVHFILILLISSNRVAYFRVGWHPGLMRPRCCPRPYKPKLSAGRDRISNLYKIQKKLYSTGAPSSLKTCPLRKYSNFESSSKMSNFKSHFSERYLWSKPRFPKTWFYKLIQKLRKKIFLALWEPDRKKVWWAGFELLLSC